MQLQTNPTINNTNSLFHKTDIHAVHIQCLFTAATHPCNAVHVTNVINNHKGVTAHTHTHTHVMKLSIVPQWHSSRKHTKRSKKRKRSRFFDLENVQPTVIFRAESFTPNNHPQISCPLHNY